MRCQACNCELSDYESVRKDQHGEYIDLCGKCYQHTKDENLLIETDRFFYVDRYEN